MPHPSYAPEAPRPPYVPFKAFSRIVPIEGRRMEVLRDFERMADRVEAALTAISVNSAGDPTLIIASPVAFTPQFGNKTARLTVVGFIKDELKSKADRTDATFDHDNGVTSGQLGGPNMARTTPTSETDASAKYLRDLLEASSSDLTGNVYKLEYAGAIYGEGGRSFPL